MEIILKKEDKPRIAEIIEFAKELSEEEVREFKYFIRGYKLAKSVQVNQERN